jgi:chromosome segregation ATPase
MDTPGREQDMWVGHPVSGGTAGSPADSLSELEDRLREASAETERLRQLNDELAADLRRVSAEAGDALAAQARAERLQRERDEARRRASQERALAADDRMRAVEAERLFAAAEARAEHAERRLVELTDHLRSTAEQLAGFSGRLLGMLAEGTEDVVRLGEAEDAAESPVGGSPRPDPGDRTA